MSVGGATAAVVPVAAQCHANGGDETPLVVFSASGFGTIPQHLRSALSCVVWVGGQA